MASISVFCYRLIYVYHTVAIPVFCYLHFKTKWINILTCVYRVGLQMIQQITGIISTGKRGVMVFVRLMKVGWPGWRTNRWGDEKNGGAVGVSFSQSLSFIKSPWDPWKKGLRGRKTEGRQQRNMGARGYRRCETVRLAQTRKAERSCLLSMNFEGSFAPFGHLACQVSHRNHSCFLGRSFALVLTRTNRLPLVDHRPKNAFSATKIWWTFSTADILTCREKHRQVQFHHVSQ